MSTTKKRREFGDHMARENTKYLHVSRIVLLTYAALLAYSLLASICTGEAWYTQVLFYVVVLVMFSAWHLLAHQKCAGTMHDVHKGHHFVTFPPDNFYGAAGMNERLYGRETPTFSQLLFSRRPAGVFTMYEHLCHEGPMFLFLSVALGAEKYVFGCSVGTIGFSLVMALVIAKIGQVLHESFHVKGFELEKYQVVICTKNRKFYDLHALNSTLYSHS